jgi:hypothetical protein
MPKPCIQGADRPGEIPKWTRGGDLWLACLVRAGDGTIWLEIGNSECCADTVRFLKNLDQRWLHLGSVFHEPRFQEGNAWMIDDLTGVAQSDVLRKLKRRLRN